MIQSCIMIDEIHVQNVALIRDASLIPSRGLTVVTGETGSGKTALLSALKLLCGERGSADMIREGSDSLMVEGRFFSDSAPAQDVVAVRKVTSEGRSRITVNGSMANVGELAAQVGSTVDLCGQHEHQRLLKAGNHREMFDLWAADDIKEVLAAYEEAYEQARDAQHELTRIQEATQVSEAKLDEARYVLERVNELDPRPEEYEELQVVLSRSENAEALAVSADGAHKVLADEQGAIDLIHQAAVQLDVGGKYDEKLAELSSQLREQVYVLEDVAREALSFRDSIEYDPSVLADNQERFAALQGLMRAFGPRMEDVFVKRDEAAELILLGENSAALEEEAQQTLDKAEGALLLAADALDKARQAVIPQFTQAINTQLDRLEMGGAQIVCESTRLDRVSWTHASPSRVEFLFSPGEGLTPRPLARIASGGEISRVMLAIKVVLGASDEVDTLVFDEVDAGVGGTAAVALAGVLADLAKTHQVLVVTHLAQVAVVGDSHFTVAKQHEGNLGEVPETGIIEVQGEARIEEVARMLSGDITQASLDHARELLQR